MLHCAPAGYFIAGLMQGAIIYRRLNIAAGRCPGLMDLSPSGNSYPEEPIIRLAGVALC
jgi:hypothetical protein